MKRSDPVRELQKMGFTVDQFSAYHFRVNGQFDFWLPRGKWHDLTTNRRGRTPLDQMHFFVKNILSSPPPAVERKEFVERLMEVGWNKQDAESAWGERTKDIQLA